MVDVQQNGNVVFLVDADKVLHDLLGRDGVEGGHRLVGQNDLGVLVQGTRQRDTLLLAAGQLVAAGIGFVQNAHFVQAFQGAHLLILGENAEQDTEEVHIRHVSGQNVLDGGAAGDQIEALEDHAHLPAVAAQRLTLQGIHIDAVHRQFTLGDIVHPVDAAQNGGLASAGQADDGDKFPLLYLQVDAFQCSEAVGIGFVYIFKFNHVSVFSFFKLSWTRASRSSAARRLAASGRWVDGNPPCRKIPQKQSIKGFIRVKAPCFDAGRFRNHFRNQETTFRAARAPS